MVRSLFEAGPFIFTKSNIQSDKLTTVLCRSLHHNFAAGLSQQQYNQNFTIKLIYIQVDQLEILIELYLKTVAEFYIITPFVTANRHDLLPCIL